MRFEFSKLGMIFDPAGYSDAPTWMQGFAQAPNAILRDDYLRVYFCTRGEPDHRGMYVSRLAFVDLDVNSFKVLRVSREPCLDLGGLGHFDEFGTYPVSVLEHESRTLAAYGGWTRCESVPFNISMGMAESFNSGVSFEKFDGPILAPYLDEPFIITSPKLRFFDGKFVLTYTAGQQWIRDDLGRPEIIYKLRIAFSDNLREWTRLGRNIVSDKLGPDEAQACGDVFYKNGVYHMFFCYREALDFRHNPSNSYKIGYASSTDLHNWVRDDSAVQGLQTSASGWDSEMLAYPNLVEVDDRLIMFYGGNGNGKTGFGAAEIKGLL